MIPAAFEYKRASSADAALDLITELGDEAKFLAGGHSLLPLMKLRLAQPSVLVDIGRLSDLSYIRDAGDHIAIGALTRHHDIEHSDLLKAENGLLAHTASQVGDPQVRHRGTIGGSIAHSDPASDLPATVLALGGTLVARSKRGERTIAPRTSSRVSSSRRSLDEMLTEIRVPNLRRRLGFQKMNRRAQDWAIVGATAYRVNGTAGVALVNMGSTPVYAQAVVDALAGGASVADAAEHAADGTEPPEDPANATPEFRTHLAKVLVRRALESCG